MYRGYTYNSWGSWVQSRRNIESPLVITLGGSFDEDTRAGELDITIYAEDAITQSGLKVRIALCEDSLYYQAANGTMWHNYTMRDMIPNATGNHLTISQGETVEFTQDFSAPSPLDLDFCYLVVWVQSDDSNYEVLQAAKVALFDIQTSIDDEFAEIPTSYQLAQNYPNPFNAKTTISYSLVDDGPVELMVYDITGRKVAEVFNGLQQAGNHQVIWDGTGNDGKVVSSGVYFYRLITENQSLTRQMMLLK
ncbi:MAG: T9SS type A sorting domain-containing protein [candidate division Zixibacteria bacterium]|nr:T9SS type A sorting domain-containing protein [candidate division Zixibacteria bacterium]